MSWDQYTKARVRVDAPGGTVWVDPAPLGDVHGLFPDPRGRSIHIITADNPGGVQAGEAENRAAHASLVANVRRQGLEYWPAVGGDPSWTHTEISLAVLGLDDALACQVGREFGQDAVFAWSPTSWVVVGCMGSLRVEQGWRLTVDRG